MHAASLFLAVASLGCALSPDALEPGQPLAGQETDLLPAPTEALDLPSFAEGATLSDLVDELARITGQQVLYDDFTAGHLDTTPILRGTVQPVPMGEVYPFVEGLLHFHGITLSRLAQGERPLLGLHAAGSRSGVRPPRVRVTPEQFHLLGRHPALLVELIVELPHLDVRQLSTSLRGMISDANTQFLLPIGINSLLISGTGRDLESMLAFVQSADHAAAGQQPTGGVPNATPEPTGR